MTYTRFSTLPACLLALILAALVSGSRNVSSAEPDSRPFTMGLTPLENYDSTAPTTQRIARELADRADVVAVYLDYGVPWPEALAGEPFHKNVLDKIASIKERISPKHKVFLALDAGAFNRRELAGYWGASPLLPRPGSWAAKGFDDPEIIKAFGNYCERMIEAFHPDYLCYAIEINMNPEVLKKFLPLAESVHARLKKAHPSMLIFPTYQIDFFHGAKQQGETIVRALLPFSDAVAVSTYPHLRGFTPKTLPADWLSHWRNLAPDKAFIVAETGFPAAKYEANFFNQPTKVDSNPQMQREYVSWLLTEAHRLNACLVTWFFPEDVNAYLQGKTSEIEKELAAQGINIGMSDEARKTLAAQAMNLGLSDEAYKARPALEEWDGWLKRPLKR